MAEESQRVDPERYRRSLERLTEIFRGISETANVVSSYRCPYKNARDRCTAQFGCRNQDRSVYPGELYLCTGDDNLDYRSAWETA
jgi:hypothetical protein